MAQKFLKFIILDRYVYCMSLGGLLCFNSMQLDRNTLPKKGLRYLMFYSA